MSNGRIVVGVDGSQAARRALQWAVAEGKARDATVLVVHAWDAPWNYWESAPPVPLDKVEEEQERLLAIEVEFACKEYPDVNIESEIVNELPARVLIDRSTDAAMVVVGSRGRGGFSGLLLGSVSQQIVNHSHCPVVVVPYRENKNG